MYFILFSIVILIIVVRSRKTSHRLNYLESRLSLLEKNLLPKQTSEQTTSTINDAKEGISTESGTRKDSVPIAAVTEHAVATLPNEPDTHNVSLNSGFSWIKKGIKIPAIIKENWLGVIGSMACIIGIVFFGITSSLFAQPAVRIGAMLFFALLLLGFSKKLERNKQWVSACRIFTSTAGVIILFATLGAGSIDGLKCIHSSLIAFVVLCGGIGANIYLAARTSYQTLASLHVLLSLLALILVPQTAILLPLGTVIALVGLYSAYRSRWDLHVILIVLGFAVQNFRWTSGMELTSGIHYLAIVCSSLVGIGAAVLHYCKKYQNKNFERLPLVAHLSNWVLFAVNIYLHAQFTRWACVILGAASIAGFILARTAKKKGILWLYQTDTILSQVVILVAIARLFAFGVQILDIALVGLIEILLFTVISSFQKEKLLMRVGYLMQAVMYLTVLCIALSEISSVKFEDNHLSIYVRMGIAVLLCWGSYVYFRAKGYAYDTLSYVLLGNESDRSTYSISGIAGTLLFIVAYAAGSTFIFVQCSALVGLLALAFWRHVKEDLTSNYAFLISIIFFHLYSLVLVPSELGIRIDFFGLVVMDVLLIFKNMLHFKEWKRNFHQAIIYAMTIQVGVLTYCYFKPVSLLIPALACLAYSLIALEIARRSYFKRFGDIVMGEIQKGFFIAGFAFLLCYFIGFTTVYLQFEALWNNISIRRISEIIGFCCLCYWIGFKPKSLKETKIISLLGEGLVELLLIFITLCIFAESSDMFRPLFWAVMALGLIISTKYFQWPRRLYIYSWIFLVASISHVAFITSSLKLPYPTLSERLYLPTLVAISLQLIYAFIASTKNFRDRGDKALSWWNRFLYRQPSISVLLPVFLGLATLFAFNFEKTLLTLLWVGLTCVYLTLGLLAKSKLSIQIAMGALAICSVRLLIFDLVQSNISIRALVFFCVGILMMAVSLIYKKFKHRIDAV